MANIRIKDIATTASTAAADDYLPLDGVTNGTRKLGAQRLTRTITGTAGQISVANGDGVSGDPTISLPSTITPVILFNNTVRVQGTNASDIASALVFDYASPASRFISYGSNTSQQGTFNFISLSSNGSLNTTSLSLSPTQATLPASLSVNGTTASTSTTTGALTVGSNVGLSGNAGGPSYFGGNLNVSGTLNNVVIGKNSDYPNYNTLSFTGPTLTVGGFSGFLCGDNTDKTLYIQAGSGGGGIQFNTAGNTGRMTISNSGIVSVLGTTASTSTTTGALTVGSNVGLSGNAGGPCYFGGAVDSASGFSTTGATGTGNKVLSSLLSASLGTGPNYVTAYIGKSATGNNAGQLQWEHTADGSTNNSFQLGIAGVGNFLKIASGVVSVLGTTEATTGGAGSLTTAGGIYATKKAIASLFQTPAYTVATLPTASASPGAIAYVTDANATTRLATVAGGGSNKVIVFSDGTNWLIL